jgi:hypothetical protein
MTVANETKDVPSTTVKREESEKKAAKAADIEKLKEDPRFALPVTTVTTSEDAYQAYLREEISEEELRAVVAANGGSPFSALKGNLERPDNAYQRDVPEDMYDDPSIAVSTVDDRLKRIEERDKEAEKAEKAAADADVGNTTDATARAQLKNEASQKALEEEATSTSK